MMFKLAFALLAAALPSESLAIPQSVADLAIESGNLNTLVAAVTKAQLVELLMNPDFNSTVFAPTDDAFAAVDGIEKYLEDEWTFHLLDILTYHVTWGQIMSTDLTLGAEPYMYNGEYTNITSLSPPMINQANIVAADVTASNGVVHVIDQVLLPFSATNNIIDAVLQSANHTTLAALVAAADLVDPLTAPGPFTLFAPIDAAFALLDNETVAHLTSPEGLEDLQSSLSYHVAEGIYVSAMLSSGANEIAMLSGPSVYVSDPTLNNITMGNMTMDHGYITINGGQARVLIPDILVSNGVIHIIDNILSPPMGVDGLVDTIVDFFSDVLDEVVEAAENPDDGGMR